MIVISTIQSDQSSSDVMEWLDNEMVLRINNDNVPVQFLKPDFNIDVEEDVSYIKSIWFRKGGYTKLSNSINNNQIINHATEELYTLSRFFYTKHPYLKSLGTTEYLTMNKLSVLSALNQSGLSIPATLVTGNKDKLSEFVNKHKDVIVKPLSEGLKFESDGQYFKVYTERLTEELFNSLEETFFPTLFQKLILRSYEIRSFYLNKKIYSMAIFLPRDKELEIDHRIHVQSNDVRMMPYQLPDNIEDKMRSTMKLLGLDTGSFDIVKDVNGNLIFLEINPSGQFGGLSSVCNYYLERAIGNYLKNEA